LRPNRARLLSSHRQKPTSQTDILRRMPHNTGVSRSRRRWWGRDLFWARPYPSVGRERAQGESIASASLQPSFPCHAAILFAPATCGPNSSPALCPTPCPNLQSHRLSPADIGGNDLCCSGKGHVALVLCTPTTKIGSHAKRRITNGSPVTNAAETLLIRKKNAVAHSDRQNRRLLPADRTQKRPKALPNGLTFPSPLPQRTRSC